MEGNKFQLIGPGVLLGVSNGMAILFVWHILSGIFYPVAERGLVIDGEELMAVGILTLPVFFVAYLVGLILTYIAHRDCRKWILLSHIIPIAFWIYLVIFEIL